LLNHKLENRIRSLFRSQTNVLVLGGQQPTSSFEQNKLQCLLTRSSKVATDFPTIYAYTGQLPCVGTRGAVYMPVSNVKASSVEYGASSSLPCLHKNKMPLSSTQYARPRYCIPFSCACFFHSKSMTTHAVVCLWVGFRVNRPRTSGSCEDPLRADMKEEDPRRCLLNKVAMPCVAFVCLAK
jgi:hypothetical protein